MNHKIKTITKLYKENSINKTIENCYYLSIKWKNTIKIIVVSGFYFFSKTKSEKYTK